MHSIKEELEGSSITIRVFERERLDDLSMHLGFSLEQIDEMTMCFMSTCLLIPLQMLSNCIHIILLAEEEAFRPTGTAHRRRQGFGTSRSDQQHSNLVKNLEFIDSILCQRRSVVLV